MKKTLIFPGDIMTSERWRKLKVTRMFKENGWDYTEDPTDSWDVVLNGDVNIRINNYPFSDAINGNLKSVVKSHIDKAHYDVFGYSVRINPLNHKGYCIEKPELQAAPHSKSVVKCPCEPRKAYIYARMIDTTTDELLRRDIRVIWMRGIQWVFYKDKPIDWFFKNPHKFILAQDEFSGKEVALINMFCEHIGLDFGELDVLRSNYDGKIYIVDVNNHPGDGLFRRDDWFDRYSYRFSEIFL